MLFRIPTFAAMALLVGLLPAPGRAAADPTPTDSPADSPAVRIVQSLDDGLRAYLADVLERNPELAARRARLRALAERPAQAAALPDPMVQASLFALPPETRVGPQRLQVGVQQRLPDKARRELRRDDAELVTERARAELAAAELRLVTQARELWLELAFVDRLADILHQERRHLERHEEAARARYAAGTGLAQGPVKIQAELTRIDAQILDLQTRRVGLLARLDALRNRFDAEAPGPALLPDVDTELMHADEGTLYELALSTRPEVQAAQVETRRAAVGEDLAETNRRPDFSVGLAWTMVESRDDTAGRLNPPEDNGRDVLALMGGINLPIWRTPREAELREALARSSVAAAEQQSVAANIRRDITDLVHRLPLEQRQLHLLRDVLERQAEEAASSAVAAYATGQNNALDLLDAEHRLFEVKRAVARAHADVAIALAQLEGAVGQPLPAPNSTNHSDSPSPGSGEGAEG